MSEGRGIDARAMQSAKLRYWQDTMKSLREEEDTRRQRHLARGHASPLGRKGHIEDIVSEERKRSIRAREWRDLQWRVKILD